MFGGVLGSARSVTKCSAFHFNGRIRYGTKGEKVEERLLVNKKKMFYYFIGFVYLVFGYS